MPVPLVTQQYPDDFQIVSFTLNTGDIAAALDTVPLFYADRAIVIDSIVYGVGVIDATEDVEIIHAATPQATTGTSVQTAVSSLGTTGTVTPTISTSGNEVASGRWVLAKFSDGVDTAFVTVTIRFRSRVA
jgi:hypothetical protein